MSIIGKILWRLLGKPEEKEFRRRLPVFAICIFISAFIWLLIKLSRTYDESVTLNIQFINQPADAVVSHRADTILYARVKAEGFHLLLWRWNIYKTNLKLDLAKLPKPSSLNDTAAVIQMSALQAVKTLAVESRLPGAISRVYPEEMRFEVARRHTKKVAVIPQLDLSFAPRYKLYSHATCIPDSILISGSVHDLENITGIPTSLVKHRRLNKDAESDASLVNNWESRGIVIPSRNIIVKLDVEDYTESDIVLPLLVELDDPSIKIKTFPEQIRLVYQIAVKDYKKLDPSMFILTVKFDPNTDKAIDKLQVEVVKCPDFIVVTRVIPESVDFVIVQ